MRVILLVLFVIFSITKSKAQEAWQLAQDKDGIKVYVSKVINSDYYAFKAIMSVRTTERKL
jgi:hypothetical protein